MAGVSSDKQSLASALLALSERGGGGGGGEDDDASGAGCRGKRQARAHRVVWGLRERLTLFEWVERLNVCVCVCVSVCAGQFPLGHWKWEGLPALPGPADTIQQVPGVRWRTAPAPTRSRPRRAGALTWWHASLLRCASAAAMAC